MTDERGVEASFELFSDSFYSGLQMGVGSCLLWGTRTRRCHWLADFREVRQGAGLVYRLAGQRGCCFLIGGGSTADQAAIERCV